jgi:hypothetical protein
MKSMGSIPVAPRKSLTGLFKAIHSEGEALGRGDRKNRKQSIGLDLAPAPRKKQRGRKRMEQIKREAVDRHPARAALEARARQMGQSPDKWQLMQFQALGEPAGQAMFAIHTVEDAVGLWSVYAAYTNAEDRFHRVAFGISAHAKTAKVEFLPESFEINPEDEPDLRDEDERERDARNNWDRWLGYFNQLTIGEQSIIQSVARGWCEVLIDGSITQRGREFVLAVENLSKVVD